MQNLRQNNTNLSLTRNTRKGRKRQLFSQMSCLQNKDPKMMKIIPIKILMLFRQNGTPQYSSTCGVKAEGSRIQGLPRVHSGTLSPKSLIHTQKKKKTTYE